MKNLRFCVNISLNSTEIPKDKNRMVLSFLKHNLEKEDKDAFEHLYGKGKSKRKEFTFSSYMRGAVFKRDTIEIPDKEFRLTLSTSDLALGILYYNSLIKSKREVYTYNGVEMSVKSVYMVKEPLFTLNEATFKAISPIVVREHAGKNKDTYYHNISDEKGFELFTENIKYQLKESFSKEHLKDIEDIQIEILSNKLVKVKHYDIVIPSNLTTLRVKAKPYILERLYASGIGSLKSSGFGLLEVI